MPDLHWESHVDLQTYNTFRTSCVARHLVRISHSHLSPLISSPIFQSHPHLVLGGGSNVLFAHDTYPGVVLKNEIRGIHVAAQEAAHTTLRVGGGENWTALVAYALEHDLGGLENLALIPGAVGAAPVQNIGAYGAELSDVLDRVRVVDLATGRARDMSKAQCAFGYRDSVFKRDMKDVLITEVTLRLTNPGHHALKTDYDALRAVLAAQGKDDLPPTITIQRVSEAVCALRARKLPDPRALANAGSFFQNAVLDAAQCEALKRQRPDVPVFHRRDGRMVVPAAWLIEQCGWKGRRVGDVGVFALHALVVVNYGGASGEEVLGFVGRVVDDVQARFGVGLVVEVNVVR